MEMKIYASRLEVARQFSEFLVALTTTGKDTHIALSGGSTPKVVFEELATNYSRQVPWQKVHLYWGDERCVSPDHEDSNYKMTVDHLLSKVAIPQKNIHRIKGEENPGKEAVRYAALLEKKLPKKYRKPCFDLVMLGMGDDGHTASIFPHELSLWDSKNYCEVATHPESGQRRITITGKVINNASSVAFLVTGPTKAQKVQEILKHQGGFASYPASKVAPRSGKLYWFLDGEAAKGNI